MEKVEKRGIKKSFWVALAALVIAVLIFVFFVVRMANKNPLAARWHSEDKNLTIEFKSDGTFLVEEMKAYDNTKIVPEFSYKWDKKTKSVDIELTDESAQKLRAASGGFVSSDDIMNTMGEPDSRFSYSISGDTLTLTGKEYGSETEFKRQ